MFEDGQAVQVVVTDASGAKLVFTTVVVSGAWSLKDLDLFVSLLMAKSVPPLVPSMWRVTLPQQKIQRSWIPLRPRLTFDTLTGL
ncbi:hypothetical protein [Vibrio vulnificus]|uniref:hypothetical protein n=1 Tax=Vibrio vulnificus TaxID=672 RepID=UPI001EEB8025|nr:hypothetical protein [Vibrio vulnificus]MCG6288869.1 hypothetical protein [Vibrio vulnificus]